jgi:hypothetical protein
MVNKKLNLVVAFLRDNGFSKLAVFIIKSFF